MSEYEVITIDGPASSGKSTLGYLFSKRISYLFIDTGYFYRLGAFLALKENRNIKDENECINVLEGKDIGIVDIDNESRILLDGIDVTEFIKERNVTLHVSEYSKHKKVRDEINVLQHMFADKYHCVMAGRDIGSTIFPNARLKFFINAPSEERARRRFNQQIKTNPKLKYEDVLDEIKNRDKMDSEREHGRLIIPTSAVIIENYNKSVDEAVDEMMQFYYKIIK